MTRHAAEGVERAVSETCQGARLTHGLLKELPFHPSCLSHRVAGPATARHAHLGRMRVAPGSRKQPQSDKTGDEPSFLNAIAEELAKLRQESVPRLMNEARHMLREAFVAVELAEKGLMAFRTTKCRTHACRAS